ncbi:MAG: RNA polymerase sigma factor [Planctomycetota bacterium]
MATDVRLAEAFFRHGNRKAYEKIVDRHAGFVFNIAFGVLHERNLAEDATQDTFLTLLKTSRAFRPTGSFRAWIGRIAFHRALDLQRRGIRRQKMEKRAAIEKPEGDRNMDSDKTSQLAELKALVSRLPLKLRTPVILKYFQKVPQGEIAAILGCSERTVSNRIQESLQRMRKAMAQAGMASMVPGLEGSLKVLQGERVSSTLLGSLQTLQAGAGVTGVGGAALWKGIGIGAALLAAITVTVVLLLPDRERKLKVDSVTVTDYAKERKKHRAKGRRSPARETIRREEPTPPKRKVDLTPPPIEEEVAVPVEEKTQPLKTERKGEDVPGEASPKFVQDPPAPPSPPGAAHSEAVLRGRVVFGSRGAPLSGILVRISKEEEVLSECLTSACGSFSVGIPGAGRWEATAFPFGAEGLRAKGSVDTTPGDDGYIEVVVPEKVMLYVQGRITGKEGNGIAGVKVSAGDWGKGGQILSETVSGPDGHYELHGVMVPCDRPAPVTPPALNKVHDPVHFFYKLDSPQKLILRFSHPSCTEKVKVQPLNRVQDGRLSYDVQLDPSPCCTVQGTLTVSGGKSLDGEKLPGWFRKGNMTTSVEGEITGDRFRISIQGNGRLILGGLVGSVWVEPFDIGVMKAKTEKKDVRLQGRPVPQEKILLVDPAGNPLPETWEEDVHATVSLPFGAYWSVPMKSGRIRIPLFSPRPQTWTIRGSFIREKAIEVSPDRFPETVRVSVLSPLLVGKILFPAGFQNWDQVFLSVGRGATRGLVSWKDFDRETGAFKIMPYFWSMPGKGDYTLRLSIPGHQPWVKKGVRFQNGEPPQRVVVTFKSFEPPLASQDDWNLVMLRGRVTWGNDGSPLPRILVRFSRNDLWYGECFSDERGRFTVGLPEPGTWKVTAFPYGADGVTAKAKADLLATGGEEVEVVVPEKVELAVTGTVKADERALEGVRVTLLLLGKSPSPVVTQTDNRGRFALDTIGFLLQRPDPQPPRHVEDTPVIHGRGQKLLATFDHPDFPRKQEILDFSQIPEGPVRFAIRFTRATGGITGTVSAPGGSSVDGQYLPYRVEIRTANFSESHGSSARIEGGTFTIRVKNAGRLIVGGQVGRFWVDDVNLGRVTPKSTRKGITLQLREVTMHALRLVDAKGGPIPEEIATNLHVTCRNVHGFHPEVRAGKLMIPLLPGRTLNLSFSGEAISQKRVRISCKNPPSEIVLERIAPLMTGTIRFPEGFTGKKQVSLTIVVDGRDGGLGRSGGRLRSFDPATGGFKIMKTSSHSDEDLYTVTLSIPGYAPWVKKNIRLKRDETLEGITVTFGK